jgi:beta-glucosidase
MPFIDTLLNQLTLDEKLAQIGSCLMNELQTGSKLDDSKLETKLRNGIGQVGRVGGDSDLDPRGVARAANTIQHFLLGHTRMKIPAIIHEECCCGAMMAGGTVFPQMLGLASTFQPELAEAMTTAIRKQLRAAGAQQALAPVLDVARDARWGRCEETFGEDPTLVSHFGIAYVRGLQGKDMKQGIMATGKHFVGHSASQGGLNCGPVHVGQRELFDVYLAPFQAVIQEAGLVSMMNAYHELDGEVVAGSHHILTELLRDILGFDGVVVSDYQAIEMIQNYHHLTDQPGTAAKMALHAGIDVELPTANYYDAPLRAALEAGDISLEMVDLAVHRHLERKIALGLFENPYVDEGGVVAVFETPENRSLARHIASQSIVLLKNDGILPLRKDIATLVVIGPNADSERNLLGDYSYQAMSDYYYCMATEDSPWRVADPGAIAQKQVRVVSVLAGIRSSVSPHTTLIYRNGCETTGNDESGFVEAQAAAEKADAVVLVLGDKSGLTRDCTCGETRDSSDLRLPGVQEKLAEVIFATGKPVIVVLVNGRPLAIPALVEKANAILEAWLPGEEGGAAVADVLFGDHNPGGKLAMTFPRSGGQTPIFYNVKPSGMRSNVYIDYVNEPVTPLYPFGHGLSYTMFTYSNFAIDRQKVGKGETVAVSCSVKNSGKVKGEEVVQLYICDEYASLPRPVKELKGYCRVALQSGESKRITFHLSVDLMAFYDDDHNLILEPGMIHVMLGSSNSDIRLEGDFEISGTGKIPVATRLFTCPVEVL